MALSRSAPLLTTAAEVVDLTGIQGLAGLEAASEFSVADSLLRAHEWVYDKTKKRLGLEGVQALTNQVELERAVAFRLLELVAPYLRGDTVELREHYGALAQRELLDFMPDYPDTKDEPPGAGDPLPYVVNSTAKRLFQTPYDRTP